MDHETNTALEQLQKSIQTFNGLSMAADSRDKLYRYNDALMQSIRSILEDDDNDESAKLEYFNTSLEQYAEAMRNLFPKLVVKQPGCESASIGKSDPDRFLEIEEA